MAGIDISFPHLSPTERVKKWAIFLKSVRSFLDGHGFWEITTDSLTPSSAIDAVLDPIKVPTKGDAMELQTSPEFEMKWWLAETRLPLYQICKSFRDDPPSPIHRKEFTMLEFYQPSSDISETAQLMKDLLQQLSGSSLKFEEYTVAELVSKVTDIDIFVDRADLLEQIQRKSDIEISSNDSWEDLFFRVMIEKVEPSMNPEIPIVLKDFPASLSSLATVEGQPPVSKRFEIYWQGMELCNGFNELTDTKVLLDRFEKEQKVRTSQNKLPHPYPTKLFAAMEKGLPYSSGVAVGMERLFACVVPSLRAKGEAIS